MALETIKQVLMRRDNMTEAQADEELRDAKRELNERLGEGEMPMDFCEERFGLEPDYLMDLIG